MTYNVFGGTLNLAQSIKPSSTPGSATLVPSLNSRYCYFSGCYLWPDIATFLDAIFDPMSDLHIQTWPGYSEEWMYLHTKPITTPRLQVSWTIHGHSKVTAFFGSCDHDLNPMTMIYKLDLCPRKMNLHIKKELLGQGFQKLKHYRQTEYARKRITTPYSRVVKTVWKC